MDWPSSIVQYILRPSNEVGELNDGQAPSRVGLYQQIDRLYRDGTLAGLGDGQLLERYLAVGDEAAFEAIVNLHGPMVLGLCRRFCATPATSRTPFRRRS